MNDHFTKTGSGRTKVGLGKALKKRDLFFAGVEEGQLITLFNGGIRNSSGARGPEVIATASNASSFGEQHCSPSDAGAPRCHYTFTVLGHWVSAAAAPQWLEWELSLRVRFCQSDRRSSAKVGLLSRGNILLSVLAVGPAVHP